MMHRRTFIYSAALGTLQLGLGGLAARQEAAAPGGLRIDVHAPDVPPTPWGMPGLYAGRVVEVFHQGALVDRRISQPAVRQMLDAGLTSLTGEPDPARAWARFFSPQDVVALKVNPSSAPPTITSMPLLREVIRALNLVGVPNTQLIVYDRHANQLEVNGYHALVPPGVRVIGLDARMSLGGDIRGYDPNVFCEMDCFGERETRSYMASVVTREATKIINLPCLKEHNASGVTGCLKNLAYGSFNNVARTHAGTKTYTDPAIAVMSSVAPLRQKSVLHIMDGLRAVYHGGPFAWNPEFVWDARTLLIGTDPVAVDRIELEIVEDKRRAVGAPSLWDRSPEFIGRTADIEKTAHRNPFYREPGHIRRAAELGLGVWDLDRIERRRVQAG